ncbi:MurR/RpiR family transcriptional regulator [Arthrobacter sp. NamB2]|uniref:MurR/RpiR family transcriptional regulator n=1 Tax=Arthrobacter sp. NamB2 TaxID=2576035 RepID=UPI0016767C89|nr:MurR/RpiR family transcriptional regulator [Arthrobacter sp. NamB2]
MAQIAEWFDGLSLGRKPSPGIEAVLTIVRTDAGRASFMSTQDLASRANVNVATVVRAAQFLGFSGWSALKSELRHRYLASLTAEKLLTERVVPPIGLAGSSLANDARNMARLADSISPDQLTRAAAILAAADRTIVLATGSYAAAGFQLAHVGQWMGRDIELHTSSGTALVNRLRMLSPGDCLVSCNLWRASKFVLEVVRVAAQRGIRIVAIADRQTAITDLAEESLLVPSEGVTFMPSTVAAVATVQALLAELSSSDPDRTMTALRDTEELWSELDLVDPI